MRDLLTGLAIVLIVALTTALVAPYLVDWNGQRAFLEARLSHALGQKVTIGGNVDLKLLPTPYLVLDQTVIGDDDAPIRMGIRHLDLQLAATPLLHGEFDITQAELREPTLRVTLQPDRSLPALPEAPAFEANLRFDRIVVDDGTIALADPKSGRTIVLDHLDLTADAPSLRGPFKGNGTEGTGPTQTSFRFATSAAQDGRARAHLVVEETTAHAGVDLDGQLTLAPVDGDAERPSFDGALVLSSHVWDSQENPIAWKLSGPLKLDPEHGVLAAGELRLGGEDAGLSLDASGTLDLGEAPKAALSLEAKQLDIDRLSGAPTSDAAPPPPKLPDATTLRRLLAAPTWPLALDLSVDTATYGGETLSDLSGHIELGEKGPSALKASGDGPGGTHLDLDGHLMSVDALAFDGGFGFEASSLQSALAWLAKVAPDAAVRRDDIPFDAVKASGHVVAGPTGIAATGLKLALDRSALTGSVRVAPAAKDKPALVTADVRADALDLDVLPGLAGLRQTASGFDLDLKLDADTIKVSQVGNGALDSGHLRLALTKTGQRIAVTSFHADNLGGATIDGSGSLGADTASLSGTIDAQALAGIADLARRLAPGRWADSLASRAAVLSPTKLKIDAAFTSASDALRASRLDVTGHFAGSTIEAHLAPDPRHEGALALSAKADAPEGAVLLAQLGVHTLPLDVVGRSRVAISASGDAGKPFDTTLDATLGATHLSARGRFDMLGSGHGGSGTATLKSEDIGPLLQSLALAFPDMTGRLPVDLSGGVAIADDGVALSDLKGTFDGVGTTGALSWRKTGGDQPSLTGGLDFERLRLASILGLSLGPMPPPAPGSAASNQPFTAGLVDPPTSAVKVKAKTLDLGGDRTATDAAFDLGLLPNVMTLRGVDAKLDGGRLTGDLTLRRDGNQAGVEGKLGLDQVDLGLRSIRGRLGGHLDIAGSGTTPLALLGSLAGSGEATLAETRVPGADPKALAKVFAAVENDEVAVDEESVVRAYDDAVEGMLDAGTREFRLGLAGGVLQFQATGAPAVTGPVRSAVDARLDLRTLALEARTTETFGAVPKDWTGALPSIAVVWSGPLDAPRRTVEVGDFLNTLAARALAREAARLEAYEFDIRERAFFSTRLQSEDRREQDRVKAEDEARKAQAALVAAAKRAADEARAVAERKAQQDQLQQQLQQDQLQRQRQQEQLLQQQQQEQQQQQQQRPTGLPEEPRGIPEEPSNGTTPDESQRLGPGSDPSAAGRY